MAVMAKNARCPLFISCHFDKMRFSLLQFAFVQPSLISIATHFALVECRCAHFGSHFFLFLLYLIVKTLIFFVNYIVCLRVLIPDFVLVFCKLTFVNYAVLLF